MAMRTTSPFVQHDLLQHCAPHAPSIRRVLHAPCARLAPVDQHAPLRLHLIRSKQHGAPHPEAYIGQDRQAICHHLCQQPARRYLYHRRCFGHNHRLCQDLGPQTTHLPCLPWKLRIHLPHLLLWKVNRFQSRLQHLHSFDHASQLLHARCPIQKRSLQFQNHPQHPSHRLHWPNHSHARQSEVR